MKNYLLFVVSLVSLLAQAQPNKGKVDSVRWKDQQLIQYPGALVQGGLLDTRGNITTKYTTSTGFRNVVLGLNGTSGGTGNFSTMINGVIDPGVIGATQSGADGHTYLGADYSDNGGDANDAAGYASFTRGFGNKNHSDYGVVLGNDNYAGKGTGIFMHAQRSSAIDDLSFTVGRAVNSKGKYNWTFATGADGTLDSIDSHLDNSFNVGFNKQWRFRVLPDNVIQINGIDYKFPTSIPSIGSVLTYMGNGVVQWQAPAAVAKPAQIPQEQPKPGKYMVMTTSGQLLYLVQIK